VFSTWHRMIAGGSGRSIRRRPLTRWATVRRTAPRPSRQCIATSAIGRRTTSHPSRSTGGSACPTPVFTSSRAGGLWSEPSPGSAAWLCHNRRMSKDYERLCVTSEAWICVALSRPHAPEARPWVRVVRRSLTPSGGWCCSAAGGWRTAEARECPARCDPVQPPAR
jgi:hypothetical protein